MTFCGDSFGFSGFILTSFVWKRSHDDYLSNLLVDEGRVTRGEFSLIVCEFVDVFPKDFSCHLFVRLNL